VAGWEGPVPLIPLLLAYEGRPASRFCVFPTTLWAAAKDDHACTAEKTKSGLLLLVFPLQRHAAHVEVSLPLHVFLLHLVPFLLLRFGQCGAYEHLICDEWVHMK
jgi:hypothetical protein